MPRGFQKENAIQLNDGMITKGKQTTHFGEICYVVQDASIRYVIYNIDKFLWFF